MNIRIWNGCKVVQVMSVREDGGSNSIGSAGGASNSIKVDIEIDPWASLIVDHRIPMGSPIFWKEDER